jgi:tRNA threonylcarbamoyladenosine biosynthesis protein TsaE
MKLELLGEGSQESLGEKLASLLLPPLIVYLEGDLGTGKTTLTRGVLRGLGHSGPVRSPTYTLLEPYELGFLQFYHLDLYRLGDPEELEFLGLRDLLDGDSVLFVEWPQRGEGALPPPDLEIRLDYSRTGRLLELIPLSPAGDELVRDLVAANG